MIDGEEVAGVGKTLLRDMVKNYSNNTEVELSAYFNAIDIWKRFGFITNANPNPDGLTAMESTIGEIKAALKK